MRLCLFCCSLLSLFFCGSLLAADPKDAPQWMKDVTRLPPGGHANLRPVKLEYTLSWNNRINAGNVEISVEKSSGSKPKFTGDAVGKSTGFARVVWPYEFEARSIIEESSLRPLTFRLSEEERSERNSYDIKFLNGFQTYTTVSKEKGKSPITRETKLEFDTGHDMLSAAFYLRSQPLKKGDKLSMVVSPFNKPYLARFEVTGRGTHKIKNTTYNAIILDAEVGKINTDWSIKRYEKVEKTTLWVSDDEYRIPLELQTKISVGFISARLVELNWLD